MDATLSKVIAGCVATSLGPLSALVLVPVKPSRFVLSLFIVFAAGAMLADVVFHQLPELYLNEGHDHPHKVEGRHHLHDVEGHHLHPYDVEGHNHPDGEGHHDHPHDVEGHDHPHDGEGHDHHQGQAHSGHDAKSMLILAGIAFFFLLDGVVAVIAPPHGALSPCDHGKKKDECTHVDRRALLSSRVTLCMLSDGLHNFMDGMCIASAFLRVDDAGAFKTVFAIALHELPHELGDVAVLMDSGLSRRGAVATQGITGLMNLSGALATVAVASISADVAELLAPFVTGTFLYIALVSLMGDLAHPSNAPKEHSVRVAQFVSFAAGILLFHLGASAIDGHHHHS